MDVAEAVRIELTDHVRLFGTGRQVVLPMGGTSWDSFEARGQRRVFALSATAVILVLWGLTMTLAGFAAPDEPTPANPGGHRSGLFLVAGGGSLMGTGLGLFLAARRARTRRFRKTSDPVRPCLDPQITGTAP